MLAILFLISIPVSAAALLYTRWEYRKRGKLSILGLALICIMLFVPNLILEYATSYEIPSTLLDYIGVIIGVFGIVLCLTSIAAFHSLPKVFCTDTGKLTITGPYRWSRNPQYVGWFLFLIGFSLNDWSLWCLAALIVIAISLHLLILVEEEHLHRTFGEQYAEFCRKVPRYASRYYSEA
jgi:protein-S-isoprenylcysteine O-methyltransferase Ste14